MRTVTGTLWVWSGNGRRLLNAPYPEEWVRIGLYHPGVDHYRQHGFAVCITKDYTEVQ